MSSANFFRVVLFSAAALVVVPACSSDSASSDQSGTAGVLYEGDATEAELRSFLAVTPDDWQWAGGAFDAPEDQATMPASAPFDFVWRSDPTIAEAGKSQATYLLTFSSPSGGSLLKVFTTQTTYTPSAGDWQKLAAAGAVTLGITGATFTDGALADDEAGPHRGQTLTFTITAQ